MTEITERLSTALADRYERLFGWQRRRAPSPLRRLPGQRLEEGGDRIFHLRADGNDE